MANSITNRQMFFILVLTLTSYSVVDISRAMAKSAGTGGWLTILATSIIFGLTVMIKKNKPRFLLLHTQYKEYRGKR